METSSGVIWCYKHGDSDSIYIFRGKYEKEIEIHLPTFSLTNFNKENGKYLLRKELVLISQLKESKDK